MIQPLLSVCIITYNHEEYIRDAIEGVLMQKINFEYEIIIADDFSTDNTRKIILDYSEKYPNIFKLIFQEKNVGAAQNWLDLISCPKSKYIAYFEGDDFWTDPFKLQKQIDFLDNNINFSCCFHDVKILQAHKEDFFIYESPPCNELYFSQVLKKHYIPSSSLVFRNYKWLKRMPDFFNRSISGDIPFELLLATEGKIKYMNEEMSCYRRNLGSVTQNNRTTTEILNGYVWMYTQLSKHVPIKYTLFVYYKAFRCKLQFFKYSLLKYFIILILVVFFK